MSHAWCGSLSSPNTEAGVAVLPDKRKFLKGLIKELGAGKAMKGQGIVFDSGVGIRKGGVGKAPPKMLTAPTCPQQPPSAHSKHRNIQHTPDRLLLCRMRGWRSEFGVGLRWGVAT
ncbi:hypothetical protein BDQ17DRAFT_1333187 [Cyathus striatus]|nr:hypothetical protein BDQ17DRAFT_1333187 [Cyathus striatus]